MFKFKIIFIAIIFLGFFCSAETSFAKELYVNNSGSPACSDATTYANNDPNNPWCTLLRAVRGNSDGNRNTTGVSAQATQAGDTVYVAAGTYSYAGAWSSGNWLGVFYDPINSGTSGARITFEAVGTVNLTTNVSAPAPVIGSNTGQYVKWVGFTINQANVGFRNGLTAATVSNVWFERNTIIGIYTDFGYGDNHPGIMIHGPRDGDCAGVISGIRIRNNSISGFTGASGRNDAAITLYCADDILIEHNEIYGSSGTGISAKSSYTPSTLTPAVTVRYNIIRDNPGSGIGSQSWSNWHVYQNLFLRNRSGISIYNFEYYVGGAQPRNYRIVNNTLYGNNRSFRLEGNCEIATSMVFRNNIAYGNTTNSLWGENASCSTGMTKSNYDFDYNLYGQGGNFGNLYYINFPLATWQSTTYNNQDTNSTSGVNPLFVNAAGGNFRLQTGSPALNSGVDILDLDNDSNTTDTIPAGAYITGSECIGLESECTADTTPPAAPSGLAII